MQIIANDAGMNTIDLNPLWDLSALNVLNLVQVSSETVVKEKKQKVRSDLLDELYLLSVSQAYETTKENRKRYHEWVRKTHPTVCRKTGFNQDSYLSFKSEFKTAKLPKEQKYLKPHRLLTEKELKAAKRALAIRLSTVKTPFLADMVGVARDILHRYERANKEDKIRYIVGKYVWGSVIWKPII